MCLMGICVLSTIFAALSAAVQEKYRALPRFCTSKRNKYAQCGKAEYNNNGGDRRSPYTKKEDTNGKETS